MQLAGTTMSRGANWIVQRENIAFSNAMQKAVRMPSPLRVGDGEKKASKRKHQALACVQKCALGVDFRIAGRPLVSPLRLILTQSTPKGSNGTKVEFPSIMSVVGSFSESYTQLLRNSLMDSQAGIQSDHVKPRVTSYGHKSIRYLDTIFNDPAKVHWAFGVDEWGDNVSPHTHPHPRESDILVTPGL